MDLAAQRRAKQPRPAYRKVLQASFGEMMQPVEFVRAQEITIAKHCGGGAGGEFHQQSSKPLFSLCIQPVKDPSGGTVCT